MAELLTFFRRVQVETSRALWAALTATLIFFTVFTLPHIRENQTAYRIAHEAEISAENDAYCRRWNFAPGTDVYRSCLNDVIALRASIKKTLADELDF